MHKKNTKTEKPTKLTPRFPLVFLSGYITVNQSSNGNMFYWFFESQNDPTNDPVILWLTGGPGCSSELFVMFEGGPFRINDQLNVSTNPYSWNKNANLVVVDSPVGTGFSYTDADGYCLTSDEVAQDLYEFLYQFLPMYNLGKNPLFITGESYAGKYVPAICGLVVANEGKAHMNLKGCACGNGMTDPITQYGAYANYAYQRGLIDFEVVTQLNTVYEQCVADINKGDMNAANQDCNTILDTISQQAGNFNVYDVTKTCKFPLCYDFSAEAKYFNLAATRAALNVRNQSGTWEMCDGTVHQKLSNDWFVSQMDKLPSILESGVRVMMYSGLDGFICNHAGVDDYLRKVQWSGQDAYLQSAKVPWYDADKNIAGWVKGGKGKLEMRNLSLAGHMVPADQPARALQMISEFMAASME
eukprot:TRINITY_DN2487_c0_g1_i4.p1 TRINITY_DN2487_c0_g1~~TRINITY_DN2487_c0_g1_i4.p1  ORF type:complete len:415 (-),score=120.46 TRINITY_DN2487_c0_g1_i4:649-1893(-)